MKNKGFTLIELLLVIGLLSVIASTMSYDVMNILSRNRVDVVAKQIAMDMRVAQQKAVEENRNWVMEFTNNANLSSYKIYPEAESTKPRTNIAISDNDVGWGDLDGNYLPTDLVFNASGGIVATADTFAVSNGDEDQIYLRFDTVTGRVTLLATVSP